MPASIFVLAGVHGAGKSSVGGAALLAHNASYFNPDLAARDPKAGHAPRPVLLVHLQCGRIVFHSPLEHVPQWAKPILAVAFDVSR